MRECGDLQLATPDRIVVIGKIMTIFLEFLWENTKPGQRSVTSKDEA